MARIRPRTEHTCAQDLSGREGARTRRGCAEGGSVRQISFALTTAQFRNRSKSVTRRHGWRDLEPEDELMGVERGQGLKKGEKVVKLGAIRVDDVRMEKLNR